MGNTQTQGEFDRMSKLENRIEIRIVIAEEQDGAGFAMIRADHGTPTGEAKALCGFVISSLVRNCADLCSELKTRGVKSVTRINMGEAAR